MVANKVNYSGNNEATIDSGAQVSNINYTPISKSDHHGKGALAGIIAVGFLIRLLGWIIAGLVLIYLYKREVRRLVSNIYTHPWLDLGIGLLGLIVIPIAAILLLVTVVGYYVGLILFVGYALIGLLSFLVGTIFVGAWIIKLLTKKSELIIDWQAVVIGSVAMGVLLLIPIIGWLAIVVIMLMAFGAIIHTMWHHISREREMESSSSSMEIN